MKRKINTTFYIKKGKHFTGWLISVIIALSIFGGINVFTLVNEAEVFIILC